MKSAVTPQPSDRIAAETERVRRIWQKLAPKYDKDIALHERLLFAGGREWVCRQAAGDVPEIAVGTGRDFEHYPTGIHLTGIDFSPAMLDIAKLRALGVAIDVDLRLGDAQSLECQACGAGDLICGWSSPQLDEQSVGEVPAARCRARPRAAYRLKNATTL